VLSVNAWACGLVVRLLLANNMARHRALCGRRRVTAGETKYLGKLGVWALLKAKRALLFVGINIRQRKRQNRRRVAATWRQHGAGAEHENINGAPANVCAALRILRCAS